MSSAPPLFARILLGISALVAVGVVYWFFSNALQSAPMPTVPPPRQAQSFNPKADVVKNPVFPLLENKYQSGIPDMPVGRENPFLPLNYALQLSAVTTVPPGGLQVPGSKIKIIQAPITVITGTVATTSQPLL
ncbi:MAG: hypothetical protein PHC53_03355 [Patescibacteria group bacterium]|nr:hypothetical protein [Patescibacteria group bacterium]